MRNKKINKYINFILLILLVGFSSNLQFAEETKEKDKEKVKVAELRIEGLIKDYVPLYSMWGIRRDKSLNEILNSVESLKNDSKTKVVILRFEGAAIEFSKMLEIKDAIIDLKKSGKKVICYGDFLSNNEYLLATACDEIYMCPLGNIEISGLAIELVFLKDLFDWLGVEANFIHYEDYKTAHEPYTRNKASEFLKEEMNDILDGYFNRYVDIISKERKISPDKVKKLVDTGFFTSAESLKNKLIDNILYYDELKEKINNSFDKKVQFVNDYTSDQFRKNIRKINNIFELISVLNMKVTTVDNKPKIALIFLQGEIVEGESFTGFFGNEVVGSDTIIRSIQAARENKNVKSIVLRIDSPGGSALASDLIWREIKKTTKEKPVIISMSDMAASGGYYIACAGDVVLCEPTTITGSIGVVGGKFNLKGLYDKVYLKKEIYKRGENSDIFSDYQGFSKSGLEVIKRLMEDVYIKFIERVSTSRKKSFDEIKKIAGGRTWLGDKAVELGLADKIGGLRMAINIAKEKGGIKDTKDFILILPEEAFLLNMLTGNFKFSEQILDFLSGIGIINYFFDTYRNAIVLKELLQKEKVLAVLPFNLKFLK